MAKDKAAQDLQAGIEALSRKSKAMLAATEARAKAEAERCGCGSPKPCGRRYFH